MGPIWRQKTDEKVTRLNLDRRLFAEAQQRFSASPDMPRTSELIEVETQEFLNATRLAHFGVKQLHLEVTEEHDGLLRRHERPNV